MSKLKLMTIVGTRPEIIKLSSTIKKCDEHFDHILVHTGQNYDYKLNEIFFNELEIREPDAYLNVVGENLGETLGNVLSKTYDAFIKYKPDALLILGDTNSCLSVISAKRLKIPIFHMEAGNRCFDENLPEEVNRRIIDHTSDVNLCYTENAKLYLYSEGIAKDRTFVVGSPMLEILSHYEKRISESKVLEDLCLEHKKYILLSAHREENIDIEKNFFELMNAINKLAELYDMPIVYSAHPRSEKFIKLRKFNFNKNVRILKPFGFFDYINLQKNSFCVISDSGTLAEEASLYNFPAVSLRTSSERPEAVETGNFIIGNISEESIIQSVKIASSFDNKKQFGSEVLSYSEKNVSLKIIKIIQGYTSVVNRFVWRK